MQLKPYPDFQRWALQGVTELGVCWMACSSGMHAQYAVSLCYLCNGMPLQGNVAADGSRPASVRRETRLKLEEGIHKATDALYAVEDKLEGVRYQVCACAERTLKVFG